jgi:hypothetical protein
MLMLFAVLTCLIVGPLLIAVGFTAAAVAIMTAVTTYSGTRLTPAAVRARLRPATVAAARTPIRIPVKAHSPAPMPAAA